MGRVENIVNYLYGELLAVFRLVAIPGTIFIFLSFFFFIFFCNLMGLAPYIFTSSSHILFTLLGSQGPNVAGITIFILIFSLILLLCLELAVACIQAYVFTILRSLYLNELSGVEFNKNISYLS